MRSECIRCIGDASNLIRATVGILSSYMFFFSRLRDNCLLWELGALFLSNIFLADLFSHWLPSECIRCIGDASNLIRATVGILITTICLNDVAAMPYYVQTIVPMVESPDDNLVEGAIGAIQKVNYREIGKSSCNIS